MAIIGSMIKGDILKIPECHKKLFNNGIWKKGTHCS